MSEANDVVSLGNALRRAFDHFKGQEKLIRQQYASAVTAGEAPSIEDYEELLERPTRRFLIDVVLRALDWDPDDPAQVAEEARSWDENGDRLYFDYLGIAPETHLPVLLVEAKGYDTSALRRPRGEELSSRDAAEMAAAALDTLKGGRKNDAVIAKWAEWLADLYTYVKSIDEPGRAMLRRVVITSGRWLIVFQDPIDAFLDSGTPSASRIHCFLGLDEIVERHADLYKLLHRQRLVDTLPLTMPQAEALELLAPASISAIFRGVVVATRESGGRRSTYPTRSIWPALIVLSAGRPFAITDYASDAHEEPRAEEAFLGFLEGLTARGNVFEAQVLAALGRNDLQVQELGQFPGFSDDLGARRPALQLDPVDGSAAAARAASAGSQRKVVAHTGEPGQLHEFIIATGQTWFYKAPEPMGDNCGFHEWPFAKKAGAAAPQSKMGYSETSFTQSGERHHCSNENLRRMKSPRCQIEVLESHLCCRACVFYNLCWKDQFDQLPCPT